MNTNPNASLRIPERSPADVVDREARRDLAALMRQFLHEELTAFQFDEAIHARRFGNSKDSAVRFVIYSVWHYYDDCKDHLVHFEKAEWDYFQRLLLLLETDRGIDRDPAHWSVAQLVALAALLSAGAAAWNWGLVWIPALFLPMGVVAFALEWVSWRKPIDLMEPMCYPFATVGDLWAACDEVGFRKEPYPRRLRDLFRSRQRPPTPNRDMWATHFVLCLIAAPLMLLLHLIPPLPRLEGRVTGA